MSEPIRILYVDDNQNDRALVRDSLEEEHGGFRVIEATSRNDFEKRLTEGNFDLVLSDFNILGFNGLQVLQEVLRHYPKMPVVIVTGTGSEEIGVEALKCGASDYVIKTPRHIQRLPQTIQAVLDKKKLWEERERGEQQLRESEALFQALAKASPVGIFRADANGNYVYVNERWCEISGIAPEQAQGRGWALGLYRDNEARIADLWHQTVREGKNFQAEYCIQRPDGHITWVLGQGVPEKSETGETLGYIGTITDITQSKKNEQELVLLDQMKSNFIRMAAHELKTPITVVKGFAQLALRDPRGLSPQVLSSLAAVNRGADRIVLIVNDLLDISRLQGGKVTYKLKPTNLGVLLREFVNSMAMTVEDPARIQLTSPDAAVVVDADSLRLEQVLSNLVTNAIKYSPKGGTIELSVKQEGSRAVVSVKDEGVGIPKANQGRIFQPFYRAHAETPLDFGGMGIGLFISSEIVKGHGGTLRFDSVEGKGSTFYFDLPLVS
jgi:two-component system CheB/CheR fusion protein